MCPIYEFYNEQTGDTIEELHPITEIPNTVETEDGVYIRRKTCNTSFILSGGKNGGWDSNGRF